MGEKGTPRIPVLPTAAHGIDSRTHVNEPVEHHCLVENGRLVANVLLVIEVASVAEILPPGYPKKWPFYKRWSTLTRSRNQPPALRPAFPTCATVLTAL